MQKYAATELLTVPRWRGKLEQPLLISSQTLIGVSSENDASLNIISLMLKECRLASPLWSKLYEKQGAIVTFHSTRTDLAARSCFLLGSLCYLPIHRYTPYTLSWQGTQVSVIYLHQQTIQVNFIASLFIMTLPKLCLQRVNTLGR